MIAKKKQVIAKKRALFENNILGYFSISYIFPHWKQLFQNLDRQKKIPERMYTKNWMYTNTGISIVYRKTDDLEVSCSVLFFLKVLKVCYATFYLSRVTKVSVRHFQEAVEKVFRSIYIHLSRWVWEWLFNQGSLNELPRFSVTW